MFFFKPKPKYDELLPPPPPPDENIDEELEEELKEKPKFFDKVLGPEEEKPETFPEQEEFNSLVKDLNTEISTKRTSKKVDSFKKEKEAKQKISKKAKPLGKTKQIKDKQPKKIVDEIEDLKPDLDKDFEESIEFKLPKELEFDKEYVELPDTLEEFNIKDTAKFDDGFEFNQQAKKPKELLEAEEEIQDAIKKIKSQDKLSFFSRLFKKSAKTKDFEFSHEEQLSELPETDEILMINNKLSKARESLIKFDLETAKKYYVEIMKIYSQVPPDKKAKVYHDIRDFYYERKSAEELKI